MPANIQKTLQFCSCLQLFDTDKDGKITHEEFTALLRSALGVSDLNMTKLFKEIDADSSGFITFGKFKLPRIKGSTSQYILILIIIIFFFCESSGEFQAFASTHPEYAKLFTTYLELQRYQALKEAKPDELEVVGESNSVENSEDSTSDKKDDWDWAL